MRLDEYYALSFRGESLCHHGIKGQAWGVTNGPPYPLGAEGKSQARENRRILSAHKSLKEARAARHTKAQTINRSIIRSNTATNKEKAKNESSKNEIRKARHAWKDAARREAMKFKADKSKVKDEERRRHEQMKTEKIKQKAERATAKTKISDERNNRFERATKGIKTPRQLLVERVINSGDKKMLSKYGNLLNNDEYALAVNRIKLQKELKNSEKEARAKKFDSFIKRGADLIGNAKNSVENLANMYNLTNNAAKIFSREGKNGPIEKFAKKGQIKLPSLQATPAKSTKDKLRDDLVELMLQRDIDRMNSGDEPTYYKTMLTLLQNKGGNK